MLSLPKPLHSCKYSLPDETQFSIFDNFTLIFCADELFCFSSLFR